MSKKNRELKRLRRWCENLEWVPHAYVYSKVKTRRGAIVGTNLDGTPIRHAFAFQAKLGLCQRAAYRDLKRRLLAYL